MHTSSIIDFRKSFNKCRTANDIGDAYEVYELLSRNRLLKHNLNLQRF